MERPGFDPNAPAVDHGAVTAGPAIHWQRNADLSEPSPHEVNAGLEVELLEARGGAVLARAGGLVGWLPRDRVGPKRNLVRTYKAKSPQAAAQAFDADAAKLAAIGYRPTSQTWAQGSYSAGAFVVALLLAIVLLGILMLLYMLVVKPDGTLTVIYESRAPALVAMREAEPRATKRCPKCAEDVMAEATLCRYCGHQFLE